ncbi:ABC transporter substrate-binding protein [Vulgatibacter sp.]|uniref:ABC transporter substrate-binding protein n=1 Tax=Vulgatibacter sp. TaxID=1971226 RepID=UPI00356954EA
MAALHRRIAWGIVASLVASACETDAAEPAEVVIAAIYPLSGDQAATGTDLRRGVELAAEIVNGAYDLEVPLAAEGGLPGLGGARIRVVFADHASDPAQAVVAAERLIAAEEAVAFLGAYESAVTEAVSTVVEAAGIPFVAAESTAPSLTERGFRWFFRTTADDRIFVENFFDFLAELREEGIEPASAAIVYEDGIFGSSVAALEADAASGAGLPVVAEVGYPAAAAAFAAVAETVRDSGAAIVFQTSFEQDAIGILQAYEGLGYRPEAILGMDAGFISPAFVETLGDDANDLLSREVWAKDLAEAKPLVGEVDALFRQRYGADMTGNSARAFTGLIVLAEAIDRAGSTDPERIREALLATELGADELIVPWDGVRFDPATGQNVLAKGIIVQIQARAYRTVWPRELATVDLVWPMRPWAQ